MLKATQKTIPAEEEPEDNIKISNNEGQEVETHKALNPVEARHHVQHLTKAMLNMEARIQGGEIKDVLKEAIEEIKNAILVVMPQMKDAKVLDVLRVIKDLTCLAIYPQSEEIEALLEEVIPSEEIPSGESVSRSLPDKDILSDSDRELITEVFETLETVYDNIGRACGLIGVLSRSLNSRQHFTLLKACVRLIVHINALPKFIEQVSQEAKPPGVLEDRGERVRIMMVPSAESQFIKKEKPNSPLHLLAATLAFKILNFFGMGVTQRKIQEAFNVRAKQLALCITGQKYMGRSKRKQRSSRSEEEPSMSKRPAH